MGFGHFKNVHFRKKHDLSLENTLFFGIMESYAATTEKMRVRVAAYFF
jgi:hypothetical protein